MLLADAIHGLRLILAQSLEGPHAIHLGPDVQIGAGLRDQREIRGDDSGADAGFLQVLPANVGGLVAAEQAPLQRNEAPAGRGDAGAPMRERDTGDAAPPRLPGSRRSSAIPAVWPARALEPELVGTGRQGSSSSSLVLQVRLEEPQILVEFAGNSGEQIRGIGVAQFVGVVDGRAHRLAEDRQLGGQIEQMILARRDAQG